VAYKLAWRLVTMHCRSPRVTEAFRTLLLDLLAFAALGTIADVVPLTGENRVLARFGLSRIKQSPVEGLRALVEASGMAGESVDADDVGFRLAPRLNACGRMGHAREAVELFTTARGARAAEIARSLCRLNDQRRATEQQIADQAAAAAELAGMTGPDRRAIVLAHEEWHQGVVGIVCSRLVEQFCRPTILMQRRPDGQCHGSGRSIEDFSLHAALERCSSHLTGFGGHDMAAGVRVEGANLGAFTDAFIEIANGQIPPERLRPSVKFDCDASLEELTPPAVQMLDALAPFGMGNPRPRVRLPGLRLASRPECFGSAGKHLSLLVRGGGATLRMVAWNWAQRRDSLAAGMEIDAIVAPKLTNWSGRWSVEPEVEDVRVVAPAAALGAS
jgi:single-stranded-DNA-specific exonuclease